jgi:hypothetical protein
MGGPAEGEKKKQEQLEDNPGAARLEILRGYRSQLPNVGQFPNSSGNASVRRFLGMGNSSKSSKII